MTCFSSHFLLIQYFLSSFTSKTFQKSRSVLVDGSRKGKTRIKAKFHRIDSVICNLSRNGKNPV